MTRIRSVPRSDLEVFKRVSLPSWVPYGSIGLYAFSTGTDDACPIHRVKIGFSGRENSKDITQNNRVKGGLYKRFYNYHTSLPEGVWTMTLLVVGSFLDPDPTRRVNAQQTASTLESRLKNKLFEFERRQSSNLIREMNNVYDEDHKIKPDEWMKKIQAKFDAEGLANTQICYNFDATTRTDRRSEWYIMHLDVLREAFLDILTENERLPDDPKLPILKRKLSIPTCSELVDNGLLGRMSTIIQHNTDEKSGKKESRPRILVDLYPDDKEYDRALRDEVAILQKMKKHEKYAMNFYKLEKHATKYQIHAYDKSNSSQKLCPLSINRLVLQRARDSLVKQTQLLSAAVKDEDTKQPKAKWVTHAFNNSNKTQQVATRKAKKYSKQEKKSVLAARRKEQAILDKPRSVFDDWLEKHNDGGRNFDPEKLQQVKNTDKVATSDEIIHALARANMKYLPVGLKLIYRGAEATIVAAGADPSGSHDKNYTLQTAKGMRLVKIPNRYVKIFKSQISQIRLG